MADAITIKALQDASLDAKSLEEVVNGDEAKQVTTRLGETYPSVKKAIKTLFENGGLPATPFATKALMTASALVDGDYAQVTDGGDDSGLYIKKAGAWVLSMYSPYSQMSTILQNYGALLQSNMTFKGYVSSGATAPVSPLNGDAYLVMSSGVVFGIQATKGQFLIRNGARWRIGDKSEVVRRYSNDDKDAEIVICTRASFGFKGLLTLTGTITVTNNYDYTGFIPVISGDEIGAVTGTSPSAAAISFYNADFGFMSALTDLQLPSTVPSGASYIKMCTAFAAEPNPYAYVKRSNLAITPSDLNLSESDNLANETRLVFDKFISDANTINTAAGWVMFKIPVTANKTYTFGGFDIDTAGYYGFFSESGALVGGKAKFLPSELPLTVTAPNVDCFLYVDVARPINNAADYEKTIVNEGVTLIPYTNPYKIIGINGYDIAGGAATADGYAKLDSDVNFGLLTADSISTSVLIANLPTNSVGLDINQAWIDESTSTIKVKLS